MKIWHPLHNNLTHDCILMQKPDFLITRCRWQGNAQQLASIRRHVFIEEQQVPEELEWDDFDHSAQHVLAKSIDGVSIATGRIKDDGHIGRMAVLKSYRYQGIGSAVLSALLEIAIKLKLKRVYLHAQVSAIPFYEKQGFICEGDEFLDAGIAHKSMYKVLK